MPEGVQQNEDIVGTDAKDKVHDEDVQELEVVDTEHLVQQSSDRHRCDNLVHPHTRQKVGVQVDPQDDEDDDDREKREQEVGLHHRRELIRGTGQHTNTHFAHLNKPVFLPHVSRGMEKAILEKTILLAQVFQDRLRNFHCVRLLHLDLDVGSSHRAHTCVRELWVNEPPICGLGTLFLDIPQDNGNGLINAGLGQLLASPILSEVHFAELWLRAGAIEERHSGIHELPSKDIRPHHIDPIPLQQTHLPQALGREDRPRGGFVALVKNEQCLLRLIVRQAPAVSRLVRSRQLPRHRGKLVAEARR
mmetsp:Transcript_3560/g.10396  ORF Transcript_3560/g.10396 Transcript_3560/m.10396 type:complete len:305 (+) Transcript_3560:2169-3083(+)